MDELPREVYACAGFSICTEERVLRYGDVPVALAPKVVETLLPFFAQPGRVISKAELMERVWPNDDVDEANLTQNVYVLRKTFERHGGALRIENVPKRGYRLVSNVAEASLAPEPAAALRNVAASPVSAFDSGARPATRPRRVTAFALRVSSALVGAVALFALVGLSDSSRGRHASSPYDLPPAALAKYLLGERYLGEGTAAGARRSATYFSALVREAPASALGYAGLAESETSLTFFTSEVTERARLSARAIAFARHAVALDPACSEAYAALGATATSLERNDVAAVAAFEEALRLDPNRSNALLWYGSVLVNRGQAREARTLFARALAVDGSVPGAVASLAWADFLLRDYREAAAFSKQLLDARRFPSLARLTLASADVELRDYADALSQIRLMERDPGMRTQAESLRAQIDALAGRPRNALARLQRLEAATNPESMGSWDLLALAAAYVRLDRTDLAYDWLERVPALERRQLASDPRFDRLRRDRRFSAWLKG